MDPLFSAMSSFRRRKFEDCIRTCDEVLQKSALDQAFWLLKMRSLTAEVYVDDVEADEDGIAELLMNDNAIQTAARPGTSLRTGQLPLASSSGSNFSSNRPLTQSERPISGMIRPGTQGNSVGTLEKALKTPRTATNSRPITSSSGRFVRLGTASMIHQTDGPFLNLSRINISKYASQPNLAKSLFEYILYNENDTKHALELALNALQQTSGNDWFWKLSLGKCFYKVNLLRDAESQFRSALLHPESGVDTFLWLGKVYLRLDQPLAALEVFRKGQTKFPSETFLLAYAARVHEALLQIEESVELYKHILQFEAINVEAIACIAMNLFYTDQPEMAIKYYRRLLQMGTRNAEVYNNLGLCCYYSQQFDMTITCFEKALEYAKDDDIVASVWYNIGIVAIGAGDKQLAVQAFRLALVAKNDFPEAHNNLGVLEMTKNNPTTHNLHQAKAFFQSAATKGSHMYEPHYNLALIGEKTGHYDLCFQSVKKVLAINPEFYAAKEVFKKVLSMYENV